MYKVLIIGSDPNELNTLATTVTWKDHNLELIGSLLDKERALRLLETTAVDILIISIPSPHWDGIELLRLLRSRKLNTRCIFLADYGDFGNVQKAIPLGIENFLLKPVEPQVLLETLLGTVEKLRQTSAPRISYELLPASVSTGFENEFPPFQIDPELEKMMINQEYSRCHSYLDQLFSRVSRSVGASLAIMRNYVIELVIFIINLMRSYNIDVSAMIGDSAALFYNILNFQNIHDLHIWTQGFMHSAIKAMDNRNLHFSPCIARAVAHIEKNFSQDISLKTMAYDLNINAAYLGQLFKAETGQLFSAYLNQIRIENAKKLLLNTPLALNDISQQCGYTNISYFYNIFKKHTGQTPSQYRKAKAI